MPSSRVRYNELRQLISVNLTSPQSLLVLPQPDPGPSKKVRSVTFEHGYV
jgi:hypothetical protein